MSDAHSKVFIRSLHQSDVATSIWPRVGFGLFLAIILGAFAGAMGLQITTVFLLALSLVLLCAWRLPYALFYLSLLTAPMLSWLVTVSTGMVQVGDRFIGGSLTVPVADLCILATLTAWMLHVVLTWRSRVDSYWKPWLPLAIPYGLLVAAHLCTVLSPTNPDPLLVVKYALRPVLFAYLASVLIPVNFIRTHKRLRIALGCIIATGVLLGLEGLVSLFIVGTGPLHVARPLATFGVYLFGDNHNVLAEWMLFTAPAALALSRLTSSKQIARWCIVASIGMTVIALLTFARSGWITLFVELLFLSATIWREGIKRFWRWICMGLALFSPLALYMAFFSMRAEVQSSTDSRAMITGIALNLFQQSPFIGVGAGTFVDHVAKTWIFTYEFGAPLESHGYIQKLIAETGLLGLIAFGAVMVVIVWYLRSGWKELRREARRDREAYAYLCAAVLGAFVYQVFNTTYWTPKLWLPVGIAFAALRLLVVRGRERDPDFLASSEE